MSNLVSTKILYVLVAVVVVAVFFVFYKRQGSLSKVSEFGKYQGYSKEAYDGNKRISDYLTLPDGRKLAYDLILPTKKNVPADKPLPVLFKYTPYLRTFTIFDKNGKNIIAGLFNLGWKERAMLRVRYWLYDRGHLMDPLFRTKWMGKMVKHGYAVIVVERPGTGASYGLPDMSFEPGAREGGEILDWIASQAWCDGNIGMYGDSFQAMIQFAIAGAGNPHLKAIFPVSSPLDNYDAVMYRGGVYNKAFASFFTWAVTFLESVITPVDSDKDGAVLAQVRETRRQATLGETSSRIFKLYAYRDSLLKDGTNLYESRAALYPFIEGINRAGVPVYMTTGWYDLFVGDMFLWYNNLTTPKRLTVRPLDHSQVEGNGPDLDFAAEAHRWFDYWLKGIDNGIMSEPPIHYYTMGMPEKEAWRSGSRWPVEKQEQRNFYFADGRTGSITSINDGLLSKEAPTVQNASDAYIADYTTTTGKRSRWTAVNWARDYPDMRSNDQKALTFTTAPLETALEITGHPVANIWLSTDAPDLDIFVYLEEVDRDGKSTYITEGQLRASHRKPGHAPFNNLGLPYQSHYQKDLLPIRAGELFELVFSLLPTSHRFQKGNRIRIALVCADADNFDTPAVDPPPKLHVLRDADHPSAIRLPTVQTP